MHPGFIGWWKHAQHGHGCGHGAHAGAGCGAHARGHGGGGDERWAGERGHGFGVRRPLRFLASKLELEEPQVAELAAILDTLKTERAQAEVDHRRTTSAYADLLSAKALDAEAALKVQKDRVESTARLERAVSDALGKIHSLLDEEQRKKLAYLLRTGVLQL